MKLSWKWRHPTTGKRLSGVRVEYRLDGAAVASILAAEALQTSNLWRAGDDPTEAYAWLDSLSSDKIGVLVREALWWRGAQAYDYPLSADSRLWDRVEAHARTAVDRLTQSEFGEDVT